MFSKLMKWITTKHCTWCKVEIMKDGRKIRVNNERVCEKCFVSSLEHTSYFDNNNWHENIDKDTYK
jgi:hypothetical protein